MKHIDFDYGQSLEGLKVAIGNLVRDKFPEAKVLSVDLENVPAGLYSIDMRLDVNLHDQHYILRWLPKQPHIIGFAVIPDAVFHLHVEFQISWESAWDLVYLE